MRPGRFRGRRRARGSVASRVRLTWFNLVKNLVPFIILLTVVIPPSGKPRITRRWVMVLGRFFRSAFSVTGLRNPVLRRITFVLSQVVTVPLLVITFVLFIILKLGVMNRVAWLTWLRTSFTLLMILSRTRRWFVNPCRVISLKLKFAGRSLSRVRILLKSLIVKILVQLSSMV